MASLHHQHLYTPAPKTNSATQPRCPVFAKPSHFITHAKRNNRLHVSCLNENNDSSQGKVDRRNMLLGLGGMYGAANLAPTMGASAEPSLAPEIDKCGTATNINTQELLTDLNCCPPFSERIIDYRLPPVFMMKTRPSAHRVGPEYIFKYNMAIDRMKRLPKDDPRSFMQQANIHCAYCNGAYNQVGKGDTDLQVHFSWLFFPFHRWYLYFYERILGKLIGDPTFSLPFWNWDNPKGMTVPPMFRDPKAAIYDPKRNQDHMDPSSIIDLSMSNPSITDPLQVVSNNLTIMYTEMIRGNSSAEDFMGKAINSKNDPNDGSGQGASERGSHTALHMWMGDPREKSGENMGNFYSAGRDPLFYCHHANVDRMWTLWQYFLPSEKVPDKRITSPDFLESEFLFYDENAQLVRVKVKDCVDNMRMGYEYERIDLPWLDYRPPPQTAGARVKRVTTGAQTADKIFPLKLNKVTRVIVPKTKKGQADELLKLEKITVDTTKFLKFDVFVNDEDDNLTELDKASYAGSYAQVPHKSKNRTMTSSISLKLTDLYKDMDIADDDTILVTLVPRHQGDGVTIGGIKIVADPKPTS